MSTTASQIRACSDTQACCWAVFKTDWGWVAAVRSRAGIKRLSMPIRTKRAAQAAFPTEGLTRRAEVLADLAAQVRAYFEGERVQFSVGVDLSALPPFRAKVLAAARDIPFGETVTYGDLARRLGKPGAARAVGQAMAHNPVPIIVPCHRVVAASCLGGFSAEEGVDLKRRLLTLEKAVLRPCDM